MPRQCGSLVAQCPEGPSSTVLEPECCPEASWSVARPVGSVEGRGRQQGGLGSAGGPFLPSFPWLGSKNGVATAVPRAREELVGGWGARSSSLCRLRLKYFAFAGHRGASPSAPSVRRCLLCLWRPAGRGVSTERVHHGSPNPLLGFSLRPLSVLSFRLPPLGRWLGLADLTLPATPLLENEAQGPSRQLWARWPLLCPCARPSCPCPRRAPQLPLPGPSAFGSGPACS